MFHKTNNDLATIISMVKGARIIFYRERLVSTLGIWDKGNDVIVNSTTKQSIEDLDWSYEAISIRL